MRWCRDRNICGKNCKLCPVLQFTSRRTILNEVDCQSHNMVYWYSCNCGQHYVGKTTQMVRERFQQHIQYVLKSEVKDHRKICQQECKFKIQETVIDEDILAREQAWIQLLGPTLNQTWVSSTFVLSTEEIWWKKKESLLILMLMKMRRMTIWDVSGQYTETSPGRSLRGDFKTPSTSNNSPALVIVPAMKNSANSGSGVSQPQPDVGGE